MPTAVLTGRLAGRLGHRPFLVGGALLYACSGLWMLLVPGTEPDYLHHWLPGLLMSGIGVGLVLPSLSGAAVSRLPAEHYAVGAAFNQATRQIGGVLGVAITVGLLGHVAWRAVQALLDPEHGDSGAKRIANPGCHATAFVLLLRPLVQAGLLPADAAVSATSITGYSGGGKARIAEHEAAGASAPPLQVYGLGLDHKHVPEMQAQCGLAIGPLFSPAVIPAHRGMVVEVPLPLGVMRSL